MNLFKKAAFCYVAPLLSILGVASAPLDAQVCDPAPCCIDWCSLLVPALVGAAAGAATAAAIKNHGKRGKRGEEGPMGIPGPLGPEGPTGPEGENPFLHDTKQSLKFSFGISSISFTGSGNLGEITPFISSPDGQLTIGQPFTLVNSTPGTPTTSIVPSPAYGSYMFGYEFPPLSVPVTITYDIIITPSNPGSSSTEYSGTATLPVSASEAQLGFNFVFGPNGTVP